MKRCRISVLTGVVLAGSMLVSLATLPRAGFAQMQEVIANHQIKGEVTLDLDDGAAVTKNTPMAKPVPVNDQRILKDTQASGTVGDWNSVRARANAIPAVGGARAAKVTAKSEESSTFSLERNGRKVDMKVALHWSATMEDRGAPGAATIEVVADITGAGACNLRGTYTLAPQPAPAKTIKVTGTGNFTMVNGGGSGPDRVVTALGQCTLSAGNYKLVWSVNVISDNKVVKLIRGDRGVQVNVDKAILSLTK
jgi:hypothetical protein